VKTGKKSHLQMIQSVEEKMSCERRSGRDAKVLELEPDKGRKKTNLGDLVDRGKEDRTKANTLSTGRKGGAYEVFRGFFSAAGAKIKPRPNSGGKDHTS